MYGNYDLVSVQTNPPYLNRSAVPLAEHDTQHLGSLSADYPATGMKDFS